jgi:hypothetical protein
MTIEARQWVLRILYRVAIDYGNAAGELMRTQNHAGDIASALEYHGNSIWQKGCHAAWKQLQILHDTGNIVHEMEATLV